MNLAGQLQINNVSSVWYYFLPDFTLGYSSRSRTCFVLKGAASRFRKARSLVGVRSCGVNLTWSTLTRSRLVSWGLIEVSMPVSTSTWRWCELLEGTFARPWLTSWWTTICTVKSWLNWKWDTLKVEPVVHLELISQWWQSRPPLNNRAKKR